MLSGRIMNIFDWLDYLWVQLRRRRVIHAAGVYAIVSWLIVFMIARVYRQLLLPDETIRLLLALTFMAFPMVLVLAWFSGTSRAGQRRTGSPRVGSGPVSGTGPAAAGSGALPPFALLLVGLIIGGTGYATLSRQLVPPRPGGPADPGSVAVLPFDNLGNDPETEYFSDGMTDEVIAQLTRVPGIKVISRTSVMRYKGSTEEPRRIGEELAVAALVEGGVQRFGDRLRVSAHLLEAHTGRQLWAETYDRELSDVFDIQTDLARRIASSLGRALGGGAAPMDDPLASAAPPTADLEAYELYLRGRYQWNRRSEEGLSRAVELLERATARDPEFALAHAGLADVWGVLPYHTGAASLEASERAREHAERALALDPSLGAAHAALGFALMSQWRWPDAEEAFQVALALSPGYATAHQWHGLLLLALARMDDAQAATRRAHALDPLSLIINHQLGLVLYQAGHPEEALTYFERTRELEPRHALAYLHASWALDDLERMDELVETLELWSASLARPPFEPGALGSAFAEGGRSAAFAFLADLPEGTALSPTDRARWLAEIGRIDQAFEQLEVAFRQRDVWLSFLVSWPFPEEMRSDPRFGALAERMGLS